MLDDPDTPARADQTAQLEEAFIADYLERGGYSHAVLAALPVAQADTIRKAASSYASSRLAEMESRAHYVHEMHDVAKRE